MGEASISRVANFNNRLSQSWQLPNREFFTEVVHLA
jgi:hypothetical protein